MTIKEDLYKPFEDIDSRKGRGGTYDYVKWQSVADRMNEVFGIHWSSDVVWQDMVGSNLVVRVRVCVRDSEIGEQFCQEGYGGAILRDGDEAGTAHKSAYSKALKDACKKWGVALHLEVDDNTNSSPTSMPSGYTGYETGQPTPPAQPAPPTVQAPIQTQPNVVAPDPTAPSAPAPQVQPTAAPTPPTQPAPSAAMGLPPTPAPQMQQTPPQPVQPAPQMPQPGPAPAASDGTLDASQPGSVTSVQEMAIEQLSRLNGTGFNSTEEFLSSLVSNANCELNRQVNTVKELSYNEAVSVIKAVKNLQQ